MRHSILVFAVLLSSASAQTAPADLKDQAAVVRYAEGASLRALNFVQGNIMSLVDAQDDFTPQGWSEFMKKLNGWLDEKGTLNSVPISVRPGTLWIFIKRRVRSALLFRASSNKKAGTNLAAFRLPRIESRLISNWAGNR